MSEWFQSLFCWKSVWEFAVIRSFLMVESSFNPCFVGNRSGSRNCTTSFTMCVLFQSLFCWKSVWEPAFVFVKVLPPMFQSLFCWKSVWEVHFGQQCHALVNVSILVLLEIGLGGKFAKMLNIFLQGFNPCFVGNRSGRVTKPGDNLGGLCFNPCFVGNRSGS